MALKISVAVGRSTDMQYHPAPDFTCGHSHRSQAAAELCQSRLVGFDPRTRNCSAKWYNSYLVVKSAITGSGYRSLGNALNREAEKLPI